MTLSEINTLADKSPGMPVFSAPAMVSAARLVAKIYCPMDGLVTGLQSEANRPRLVA
jgi:hypothetical protein